MFLKAKPPVAEPQRHGRGDYRVLLIGKEEYFQEFNNAISHHQARMGLCFQPVGAMFVDVQFTWQHMYVRGDLNQLDKKQRDFLQVMDGFIVINSLCEPLGESKTVQVNPAADPLVSQLREFHPVPVALFTCNQAPSTGVPMGSSPVAAFSADHAGFGWGTNWLSRALKDATKKGRTFEEVSDMVDKLGEQQVLEQFEAATLPLELWNNYGRLYVVWAAMNKTGYEDCLNKNGWLCTHWKRYKESVGHGEKWHYTLTTFWVRIIHSVYDQSTSFRELYQTNADLQNGALWKRYYSEKTLMSDAARNDWVEPDSAPLRGSV